MHTQHSLGDVINHWRQQQLELDKLSNSMGPSVTTYLRIPHTYCWSPALVPKPTDWGSEIGKSNVERLCMPLASFGSVNGVNNRCVWVLHARRTELHPAS